MPLIYIKNHLQITLAINPYGQVGLIYYYLGNKSEGRKYIQTAKKEYIKNGFESNFYSTFPQTLLNELNIN